ncbi:hypothetical protein EJB05_10684, partial [Eragrostis curvula]
RGNKQPMMSLPLDLLLEIAACSDPATLVRCAVTCRDMRRRVTDDPTFRGRLRLRHADRFVPSLLHGFLIKRSNKYNKDELHLVDTTTAAADAAATSKLVTVADGFPPPDDDEPSQRKHKLLASRDGLVLVHAYSEQLQVCDPATGHSHTLPPEPEFSEGAKANSWEPYVFLVGGDIEGGAGVGRRRPFQVLKTNLVLSCDCRYLQIHTFSSENGTWSPYVKIQTPGIRGIRLLPGGGRPLVTAGSVVCNETDMRGRRYLSMEVADEYIFMEGLIHKLHTTIQCNIYFYLYHNMVHWLCLTDAAGYVLSLDASTAQVSLTTLPRGFPRMDYVNNDRKYLLATTPTGERPVVLVADRDRISLWMQSKLTAKWKQRPEVVSMNEALVVRVG